MSISGVAPTIGVCGFGRCGSTMAMSMLKAGGIPFVDGSDPDTGELSNLALDSLSMPLEGRAVKLLDWILCSDLPPANWRFIWLDRDPIEQAKSTAKFLAPLDVVDDGMDLQWLADSYNRDRPYALTLLRSVGPVLVLEYGRVLAQPKKAAKQIAMFLAGSDGTSPVPASNLWFDVRSSAVVVHRRDWRCRPDFAFEIGLAQRP